MEDLIKTFPFIHMDNNKDVYDEEVRRPKTGRRRKVSPGRTCKKPSHLAMSGEEKEAFKAKQSECIKAWLQKP